MPNMPSYHMPGMPNMMAHMLQQPGLRAPAAALPNMAAQNQVGAACTLRVVGACAYMGVSVGVDVHVQEMV